MKIRYSLAPMVLFAFFLSGIYLFIWWYPQHEVAVLFPSAQMRADTIIRLQYLQMIRDSRAGWAQIVAGSALLIGLVFAGRQAAVASRNASIAQEGQITERFVKAIDQLGNAKLEIRLGGIYGLERIARDSLRDHWTVVEVLTAYIRERAPWSPVAEQGETHNAVPIVKPAADIQAALTVLGRRGWIADETRHRTRLDLSHTDLRGVKLDGANFAYSTFTGSALNGAEIKSSDFHFASMIGVDFGIGPLSKGYSRPAEIRESDFRFANLSQANFAGVNYTGLISIRQSYEMRSD